MSSCKVRGGKKLARVIWRFLERVGPRSRPDIYTPGGEFRSFLLEEGVKILGEDYVREFLELSEEARRKRVDRAIQLLEELGVVRVDVGGLLWYWAHEIAYEERDRLALIRHASLIIPGFLLISEEYGGKLHLAKIGFYKLVEIPQVTSYNYTELEIGVDRLKKCAIQHLMAYDEYGKVRRALGLAEKLKEVEKGANEVAFKGLVEGLRGIPAPEAYLGGSGFEKWISSLSQLIFYDLESGEDRLAGPRQVDEKCVSVAGVTFSHKDYEEDVKRICVEVRGKVGGYLVEKLDELIQSELEEEPRVMDVAQKLEFVKKRLEELGREADEGIMSIIRRVVGGEPLKGRCDECPRVKLLSR